MKKVYIDEGRLASLLENEWNFHIDKSGKGHDGKPYGSDTKFSMAGRETGHFGSGTYFSTYPKMKDVDDYGELSRNQNPNFIEISNHLYRVDFDLYKNLYRVKSKQQGDVLYTMCYELNRMYNKIHHPFNGLHGEFIASKANYECSEEFQKIERNSRALGLKCPSYYELIRMCQRHDGVQSFSTVFMEWNGYNGVNVSGIEYYDNTKHGSVIYDLSKVSDDMREVDVNIPYSFNSQVYNDTVAYDVFKDYEIAALKGDNITWCDEIASIPKERALRILKNYTRSGHVLSPFKMNDMDDDLLKRYLGILYSFLMKGVDFEGDYVDGRINMEKWLPRGGNGIVDEILGDKAKYYARLIERVGSYQWVNVVNGRHSMFEELLWEFSYNLDWNLSHDEELSLKEEYLKKLMCYLKRGLTSSEEEFVKEDYYG